jgi:phosphatidylglycerophosphate synthase
VTYTACTVNLPNFLTLLRIFIVPLLVVVLLTPFSENWFGVPRHVLGVLMFLGAALTDYLDGRIARSRGQVTRLGQAADLRGAHLTGRKSTRAGVGGCDHYWA